MAQLTQAQVLAYNKKVTDAKDKASQDKARKDLAEKELKRVCDELSAMLGKTITPENLEAEYEAFTNEALKTMVSGEKILNGLEREQDDALLTALSITQSVLPTTKAEQTESDLDAEFNKMLGIN